MWLWSKIKARILIFIQKKAPVASLRGGGAACPECHHFGVTPFYNVFVLRTFCFNLLGLNPHTQQKPTEFLAKPPPFFFWCSLLNRKPTEFLAKTFFSFFFGLHLLLNRKLIFGGDFFFYWSSLTEGWHHEGCVTHTGWHHALPAPGVTIHSNAFERHWVWKLRIVLFALESLVLIELQLKKYSI